MVLRLVGGDPLPGFVLLAVGNDHRKDRDDGNVGHVDVR